MYENSKLTKASNDRIEAFVDWFIRSNFVEMLTVERDSDFINEPERAERCYAAAKDGCDGKTHAEVIDDWRDAFKYWMKERNRFHDYSHFENAVSAHFDTVEGWHDKNGSLWQQIG